jgi:hypothetical protein
MPRSLGLPKSRGEARRTDYTCLLCGAVPAVVRRPDESCGYSFSAMLVRVVEMFDSAGVGGLTTSAALRMWDPAAACREAVESLRFMATSFEISISGF